MLFERHYRKVIGIKIPGLDLVYIFVADQIKNTMAIWRERPAWQKKFVFGLITVHAYKRHPGKPGFLQLLRVVITLSIHC